MHLLTYIILHLITFPNLPRHSYFTNLNSQTFILYQLKFPNLSLTFIIYECCTTLLTRSFLSFGAATALEFARSDSSFLMAMFPYGNMVLKCV